MKPPPNNNNSATVCSPSPDNLSAPECVVTGAAAVVVVAGGVDVGAMVVPNPGDVVPFPVTGGGEMTVPFVVALFVG